MTNLKLMNLARMEIKTSAGTICVYENADPGAPGCTVMFRPNGSGGYEIDLACIEVKENPEYQHNGETEEDVCVYMYADPYIEDFTHKFVIKREDVVKALEIEEV